MTIKKWIVPVVCALSVLCVALPLRAEEPKLEEYAQIPLPSTMKEGEKVVLTFVYTDKDDDRLEELILVDNHNGQTTEYSKYDPEGKPDQGMRVRFTFSNGFPEGAHQIFVKGKNTAGETMRFPKDPNAYHSFSVTSLLKKWLIVGGGSLLCILLLPLLTYLISRTLNPQGNPSNTARISLLFGVIAAFGLFVWMFMGEGLLIGIGAVVALAILVLVFTRK